jgi:putative transposase
VLSGRRYRLELTAEQAALCQEIGDVCRSVWNTALEQRRGYRKRGAWMNYVLQAAQLAEAKGEHPWLKTAPSHVLQQTLRDLDRACREHGTFKVRWRSKARWNPSFRFPAGNLIRVERLGRKWGQVKLPKLGWVRFRWSRRLGGEIRSATVSRRGGQWFVAFLVDDARRTPDKHAMPGTAVGIDRGVTVAAVTSDGTFHDRQFITPGESVRYRRLQQKLARQKKGSANRRKTIAAMGRIMARVTDRRADFCAYTANRITARNALVVLEDLRTRNMTASASGTSDRPGRGVRQKAGLNRAILDKGRHRLELALRNAARSTGSRIVVVNPAYTSQTCNRCGHVDARSRKSQAVFVCTTCGDLGTGRSAKQEPVSRATGRNP